MKGGSCRSFPGVTFTCNHKGRALKKVRFDFSVAFWFPAHDQLQLSDPCSQTGHPSSCMPGQGHLPPGPLTSPAVHALGSPMAVDRSVRVQQPLTSLSLNTSISFETPSGMEVECVGPRIFHPSLVSSCCKAEHVGFRSPCPVHHPSIARPSRAAATPQSNAAQDACQVAGSTLVRAQRRGRFSTTQAASPALAVAKASASSPAQLHFTSFDLLAGAVVMTRQESWNPDACVRRAITASQVPDPIGRLLRANVPGWPTPQAIVSLGGRFYTHVPCVLVFQAEPHVPIAIEALPWETPAHLIRFAPPHMGLVGAAACWVNGFQAECHHRIPPDTDWIELQVAPLTEHEARICAAAFARLPRGTEPCLPLSWRQAGFFPRHGFPAGVLSGAHGLSGRTALADMLPPSSASSSEDYFSSSHSGSPDCARASGRFPLWYPPRASSAWQPVADFSADSSRTLGAPQTIELQDEQDAFLPAPPLPRFPRRWGRREERQEERQERQEFADILSHLDGDEAEMTVFDPMLHFRVVIGDRLELMANPVQLALDKSPYLPAGFTGRILRHVIEGYPCPQVVLFEDGDASRRTAPVDMHGEGRRICTISFPSVASVFELTLRLTESCQAPSTLRFQVARRHALVEVNGLRAPRFEAGALADADVVQIKNIKSHWTPKDRPDILALAESSSSVTPELLMPLIVRRSFTHPVTSVVVHQVGRPFQSMGYDPNMRPAAFRAHVLSSLRASDNGVLKVPLLSPHFEEGRPHVVVLDKAALAHHKHWAIFHVRRLHSSMDVQFFLAPMPAQANVGFVIRMTHERLSDVGPMAGAFHNHSWMTDEWRPFDTVSLLTMMPQGANIVDAPPAVYHTLDLLESNPGYQSAFCRYEDAFRGVSATRRADPATTSTTTWMRCPNDGKRAINPDPVHEGPVVRDPRDHVICIVASPQCLPGAFKFHESIDLPELPTRALYYVAQHAFVPKLPMVRFSPVVYRTLARIPLLYATVSAEHEPQTYIWIDPLPRVAYPLFRPLDGPATLDGVMAVAGLDSAGPMFATINGQLWTGEAHCFSFGDVVQIRSRKEALCVLSLDSWRFQMVHSTLLFRPVFGPVMSCQVRGLQTQPSDLYRRFTREVLYTHFRSIFTTWARDLILLPGSFVVFVGPGLPPVRIASGVPGQPTLAQAQVLFDRLFRCMVGGRTVASMDMQLSEAWLFAAVPAESFSVTWVYTAHWGLNFIHSDCAGAQLEHHPVMERSCVLPEITFGSVGVAIHTFDNRERPVLQRRTLRAVSDADEHSTAVSSAVSLLQTSVKRDCRRTLPECILSVATPCRSRQPPLATAPAAESFRMVILQTQAENLVLPFNPRCNVAEVARALLCHTDKFTVDQLVPVFPQPVDFLQCVVRPALHEAGSFVVAVDMPDGETRAVEVWPSEDASKLLHRMHLHGSLLMVDGVVWQGPAQGCYTGMRLQVQLQSHTSVVATIPPGAPEHNRAAFSTTANQRLLLTGLDAHMPDFAFAEFKLDALFLPRSRHLLRVPYGVGKTSLRPVFIRMALTVLSLMQPPGQFASFCAATDNALLLDLHLMDFISRNMLAALARSSSMLMLRSSQPWRLRQLSLATCPPLRYRFALTQQLPQASQRAANGPRLWSPSPCELPPSCT